MLPTTARELDTDEVAVGSPQTMVFSSGAIVGVFLPRLSDRFDRRRVLTGGLALPASARRSAHWHRT